MKHPLTLIGKQPSELQTADGPIPESVVDGAIDRIEDHLAVESEMFSSARFGAINGAAAQAVVVQSSPGARPGVISARPIDFVYDSTQPGNLTEALLDFVTERVRSERVSWPGRPGSFYFGRELTCPVEWITVDITSEQRDRTRDVPYEIGHIIEIGDGELDVTIIMRGVPVEVDGRWIATYGVEA